MEITRHDWILYHDIASFAFAVLLILHLLLHGKLFRNIRKILTPDAKEAEACVT